jgi:hypothetical protein
MSVDSTSAALHSKRPAISSAATASSKGRAMMARSALERARSARLPAVWVMST